MKGESKMKDHVNFAYVIYLTPFGKGYGCFALKELSKNNFRVSTTFCSPRDRKNFDKAKARKVALGRLNSDDYAMEVSLDEDILPKVGIFTLIYAKFFKDLEKLPGSVPQWAIDANDMSAFSLTLREDNVPFIDLVDDMDLSSTFFEKHYNWYKNFGN